MFLERVCLWILLNCLCPYHCSLAVTNLRCVIGKWSGWKSSSTSEWRFSFHLDMHRWSLTKHNTFIVSKNHTLHVSARGRGLPEMRQYENVYKGLPSCLYLGMSSRLIQRDGHSKGCSCQSMPFYQSIQTEKGWFLGAIRICVFNEQQMFFMPLRKMPLSSE